MSTVIMDAVEIHIPNWVVDLDSFRRWSEGDDLPEQGRIWWLTGEVWADMSREQIFSHLAVKNEFSYVLTGLVKKHQSGLFLHNGLLLSNFEADIAGQPDATFLTNETLASDRIHLIEGKTGGFTELQGTPDMVLEVVSDSSVEKDTMSLRHAYRRAGIPEYWLVDARNELSFAILDHTPQGYAPAASQGGWVRSNVFNCSFFLHRSTNRFGHPEYQLDVR